MRTGPLRFCLLGLGDGTVCERLAGHPPPCSPDPTMDFPIRFEPPPTWDCPHCDWPPSVNPNDVANHYCSHCRHFCDDDDSRRFADIWMYCLIDHGVGTLPGGPCSECAKAFAVTGPPDGKWNEQGRAR